MKRTDVGQTSSESTAVIEYRAPAVPVPVPTLFKTALPALTRVAATLPAVYQDREPLSDECGKASKARAPQTDGDSELSARHPAEDPATDRAGIAPAMPPAATLEELPGIDGLTMVESPSVVPEEPTSVPPPFTRAAPPAAPAAAVAAPPARAGRFVLLAASVALAASIGAVAGSLGDAELQRHLLGAAEAPRSEIPEDVRGLKDTVAQLRANVKTLADSVAAMRASMTASSATVNGQLSKLTEALDRGERRTAAVAPVTAPETTGSITVPAAGEPKPPAKPPIVEGWAIRKVYDGAALIEGRYGIVEVEPGMNLPGLGRIQDIRRQDGHWVVVTPKGLIMPIR
ncbi:MAG TPA: hypothetical protein VK281_16180 [Xanthobacteraceae bacterium]|nr:hypothetical protein [Xanthobacteraceae bacterium]